MRSFTRTAALAAAFCACFPIASHAQSPTPTPSPSPTPLKNIAVVSVGTKTRHPLVTLPVQADRISHNDIAATPGRTIESTLNAVPGYTQSGTSSWYLGQHSNYADLRGLGPGSMLVLLDGVPINDPLGSWVSWSRVPKLAVQSIEVAHGGSSSLYGSEAVGGVVSIETVRPTASNAAYDLFAGNMRTAGGAIAVTQNFTNKSGLLVYADREDSNGYIRGADPDTSSPLEPFARYDGKRLFTAYSSGDPQHGAIDAGFLSTEDQREGDYTGPTYYYGREGFMRFQKDGALGSLQAVVYDNFDNYVFDRFSVHSSDYEQTGLGTMGLDAVGFTSSLTHQFNDVSVTVGVDGKNIAGNRDEVRYFSPTMLMSGIQQFIGTYGQIDYARGRFEAITGARFDGYSQRQAFVAEVAPNPGVTPYPSDALHHLSPRAALRYSLTPRLNLRASYSNAFKAPDWGSLYSEYPSSGGSVVVGNPFLKAMTTDEREVGFDWTPDNMTRFYATLYEATMNNRGILALTAPKTYSTENVSLAYSGGYELSLERLLTSHASVRVSYANAPSRISDPSLASTSLVIPEDPQKSGTVAFRLFDARESIEVNAQQIGQAYYDEANTQPIDNVVLFNATASHALGRIGDVYVDLQNIFNRQWYAEPTTYAPPRSIIFGLRRSLP